jgi:hypothetical protein
MFLSIIIAAHTISHKTNAGFANAWASNKHHHRTLDGTNHDYENEFYLSFDFFNYELSHFYLHAQDSIVNASIVR